DKRLGLRNVKTAEQVGTMWIVEQGVSRGEKVVVSDLARLRPGMTVRPVPVSGSSTASVDAPGRGTPAAERSAMSSFFGRRPIGALVIAILMVLVGGVAMATLPIAQYPNIVPPQIQLTTTYTGADALSVEQSVATPIEQQISGAQDLIYLQSTNANDGSFNLQVNFDVDTDVNIDQVNTQNKGTQAQPFLPPDVTNYGLSYVQSTGLPLIAISLYSPKGSHDPLFL